MQEERDRHFELLQSKIQSKIDRHATVGLQKIKDENAALLAKQEEEKNKVRELLYPAERTPLLHTPMRDIETRLRIPDF